MNLQKKLLILPIIIGLLSGCTTDRVLAPDVVPTITSEKALSLSDAERDILLGLTVQPKLSILEGDALDQEVTRIKQEFTRQLFEKYNALLDNIDSDWGRATDVTVDTSQESCYKIARTCGFEVAARFYYMHRKYSGMDLDDCEKAVFQPNLITEPDDRDTAYCEYPFTFDTLKTKPSKEAKQLWKDVDNAVANLANTFDDILVEYAVSNGWDITELNEKYDLAAIRDAWAYSKLFKGKWTPEITKTTRYVYHFDTETDKLTASQKEGYYDIGEWRDWYTVSEPITETYLNNYGDNIAELIPYVDKALQLLNEKGIKVNVGHMFFKCPITIYVPDATKTPIEYVESFVYYHTDAEREKIDSLNDYVKEHHSVYLEHSELLVRPGRYYDEGDTFYTEATSFVRDIWDGYDRGYILGGSELHQNDTPILCEIYAPTFEQSCATAKTYNQLIGFLELTEMLTGESLGFSFAECYKKLPKYTDKEGIGITAMERERFPDDHPYSATINGEEIILGPEDFVIEFLPYN